MKLLLAIMFTTHVAFGEVTCTESFWEIAGRVVDRLQAKANVWSGSALAPLSPEAFAIFTQNHLARKRGETYEPTLKEWKLLREQKLDELYHEFNSAWKMTRMLNYAHALWSRSGSWLVPVSPKRAWRDVKPLSRLPQIWMEMAELRKDGNWKQNREKSLELAREGQDILYNNARNIVVTTVSLLHLLYPFPRMLAKEKLASLHVKILDDPNYEPNQAEKNVKRFLPFFELASEGNFIEKFDLKDHLERFRKDSVLHGKTYAKLVFARQLARSALWLGALGAMGAGYLGNDAISVAQSFDEGTDADEHGVEAWEKPGFKGMSRYDDEKVELIFNSPLPHVAIRVGSFVYNYGMGTVDRYNFDEYKASTGFGSTLSGNHTRIEIVMSDE